MLLLSIQPDEGISMRFGAKVPGPDVRIRDVRMDFRYGTAFGGETMEVLQLRISRASHGRLSSSLSPAVRALVRSLLHLHPAALTLTLAPR